MRRLMSVLSLAATVVLASIFPEAEAGPQSARLNLSQRASSDAFRVAASGKIGDLADFPEAGQGAEAAGLNPVQGIFAGAIAVVACGKIPAYSAWLPVVMRSSPVVPPLPTPTSTPTNGLTVRGHVRVGESNGPGLEGVAIHLFFSSYYPGDVVATTDADGYYETAFICIPGDEMVTVWPELSGYAFYPPQHYWRHYAGVEHAVRDFVAHAVAATATATQVPTSSPTPTGTATHTATPTATATSTASPTATPTASATSTASPTATPTLTATPTRTSVPAPGDLHISALHYSGSDEYVEVTNRGGAAQLMTGWRIHSVTGNQWYSFPWGYTLAAGAHVRVHSGPGAIDNPPSDLKWTGAYIWNNDGDEARLYDAQDGLVDSWAY